MQNRNLLLVVLNTVTFALMLFVNYASNVHVFADVTVADISHKYDTLFAPAGYAFIIWSVIFLLCLGFVIYQWVLLKNDGQQYIQRTGLWFALSNITNAAWIYCWINEQLGWCVVLILILLLSLVILTIKLKLELNDEPVRTIFFIWWPIGIYLGWIMVATIACIASYLVFTGWYSLGIAADTWTIIMIVIASLIYIFINQTRNLRESVSVGIWAFIAIAVRQFNVHNNITAAAIIASLILTILIVRHGYKNSYYSPFAKIKRGEWK
jgi:hypothetical protein